MQGVAGRREGGEGLGNVYLCIPLSHLLNLFLPTLHLNTPHPGVQMVSNKFNAGCDPVMG